MAPTSRRWLHRHRFATSAAPVSNEPKLTRIAHDLAVLIPAGGDGHAIFIASDVRLYSEGLALVFAADGRLYVSHVADTAERTVLFIRDTGADALLLDASMHGALTVMNEVRTRVPGIPIVLFGVARLSDQLAACVDSGAAAFVSRDATSKELLLTLLSAVRGEAMLSNRSRTTLRADRGEPLAVHYEEPSRNSPLTTRERQLASLLDEGLSNKEIALRLSISVATVKNHVHRILEKLHVARRGQAASRLREPMNLRI